MTTEKYVDGKSGTRSWCRKLAERQTETRIMAQHVEIVGILIAAAARRP
jgi:hypothetical protein